MTSPEDSGVRSKPLCCCSPGPSLVGAHGKGTSPDRGYPAPGSAAPGVGLELGGGRRGGRAPAPASPTGGSELPVLHPLRWQKNLPLLERLSFGQLKASVRLPPKKQS